LVDHWKIIDQTANLDLSWRDLEKSNERNKKRRLNEEPIAPRTPSLDIPPVIPWKNLPCAEFDGSTFFSKLRSQQMFLPEGTENNPFRFK
tara:strand:+ start:5307 stop:5576 length:270 start_codon:yes stop_codon:yes gene_type:complete